METQFLSGDLVLLSKLEGHAAAIIHNSQGGTGLLISSETSRIVNTGRTILMYKILINGKISHVTNDRIIKVLGRGKDVFLEK